MKTSKNHIESANAAKQQGSNRKSSPKGKKGATSPKGKKSDVASKEAKPEDKLSLAIAKADKATKAIKASKEACRKASDSLKAAQFKAKALNTEAVVLKRSLKQSLTVEDSVLYNTHRVSFYASQNGLDKALSLVAAKLNDLKDEFATAKAEAKSLNAAVRNLLADWSKFSPIFKSVGLKKSDISPSLLKEASPFLTLPTGEGIKVAAVTRRVKRDRNGNPLKVGGKKQYEACLKAITQWDAMTFATTAIAVVVTKGVFSAKAEKNQQKYLEEAEQSLKALAEAKAAAKAAKQAEREAKRAAKAAEVAEEKASKEAIAADKKAASKEASKKSRQASKEAKHKIAKIDAKASSGAETIKAATKGSKKGRKVA